MAERKSHHVAFILSFLLPGAGLWYLGKWKHGFINLGVVLALGFGLAAALSDETFFKVIRWVAIGCVAGSAGLAQTIAQQMNRKIEAEATADSSAGSDAP